MHLPGRAVDVPTGRILMLAQRVEQIVNALEDSAFLLTLGICRSSTDTSHIHVWCTLTRPPPSPDAIAKKRP